ncbi:MAG TPA: transglycosylase SLT domain-containing protein, partial [Dissulfurispiraceae bacterium]
MKKRLLFIWTIYFLVLGLSPVIPLSIDSAKDNAWASVQEAAQSKASGDQGQAIPPGAGITIALPPADKAASAAPAEGQPAPAKDAAPSPASSPATSGTTDKQNADKQTAVVSPEIAKIQEFKSPVDPSFNSNETALKAIGRNVDLFTDRIREKFSIWLERSSRYIEIMKDILREKQLPEELVFLPIIESGFNLNAYSRAKAVGPWQFIASTGKRYGLVIDWWRDERRDPVKSTQAAAEYLKDLYKMFGSWNLALAAYNAGEGKISKALKRSGADSYWDLLNTKQIKSETKEYVPQYIAATMIANTPEEYGFTNLDYHEPLEYDEVTLHHPMDIEVIAKCAEATVKEIRELNPELRRWSTPLNVSKYTIRIPSGSKEIFEKHMTEIPVGELFTVGKYTARKGDTVKKIAKRTGVPVNAILAMNSMSGIERISAGEEVKIPPKEKFTLDPDDKA